MLRYQVAGARKDKGLGSYPAVGLKEARQKASEDRALIAKGVDPIEERKAARKAAKPVPTFEEIAANVIADAQEQVHQRQGPLSVGATLRPGLLRPAA